MCRRGLPDYACLSLDTFLKNGEALFAAHPTLREVALYGLANRCSELTMSPLLAKLDTLEIADWPTEDDAASLSVSPHLDKIGRFKLWLGEGEPRLLRELTKQASAGWPCDIELVQVYGGAACHDPEEADSVSRFADNIASEANERLGRPGVRVTRPFEYLFPIDGDTRRNICAGRLPDGRPALAAASFGNWVLVTFTEDGRVQDTVVRESPVARPVDLDRYGQEELRLEVAFEEWVYAELRLEPGVIWVREFGASGLRVRLWPDSYRERLLSPSPTAPQHWDTEEWTLLGEQIRGWLEARNCVINWHNDYWADWRGKIHSS